VGKLPSDDVNFAVALHQIVYETVDPWGRRIEASGALFLPEGVEGALPLLSYQHGTAIFEDWVPSQNDAFYFPMGLLYASDGYAVFLPDYVGLGESPGFHPYLHAKTEATAVVDGLRAVRAFCAENSVALNDALFLAGYSQGGHATAAAHRELEEFHEDEFTVTASAPMAGPYDLQESLRHILGRTNYPSPAYVVVAMAAWRPIYAWETTFEGMLADDHADTLSALINRRHKYHEVSKGMPSSLERALAPEFVEALREDPEHFLWKASADNDLLDWAPKAPVKLLHCRGDRIVPHENALTAEERWTENGACCVEVEDPGGTASLDHGPCQSKSLVAAKEWFDTFREKADGSG
jgi:pimeloyl-ACP methyl ester carboxylesterase